MPLEGQYRVRQAIGPLYYVQPLDQCSSLYITGHSGAGCAFGALVYRAAFPIESYVGVVVYGLSASLHFRADLRA